MQQTDCRLPVSLVQEHHSLNSSRIDGCRSAAHNAGLMALPSAEELALKPEKMKTYSWQKFNSKNKQYETTHPSNIMRSSRCSRKSMLAVPYIFRHWQRQTPNFSCTVILHNENSRHRKGRESDSKARYLRKRDIFHEEVGIQGL